MSLREKVKRSASRGGGWSCFSLMSLLVALSFLGAFVYYGIVPPLTQRPVTATLNGEYNRVVQEGKTVSDVFFLTAVSDTGEDLIFQNTNNVLFLKFNSHAIQQQVRSRVREADNANDSMLARCDFLITGFRLDLLGIFPNVVSMTCPSKTLVPEALAS